MTPKAQQIAIAEVCGLYDDYLSDLNAMHEAEKVLCDLSDDVSPWETYDQYLGVNPTHATAAQRAEAFLRTLNLWDDTK